MACQSAINDIFRNMSLLNTRLPGLIPKVECAPARMACIVMDNALSINSLALAPVMCWGGWPCRSVLSTFPTVWCMHLHIALACGFSLVVGMSLIWQLCHRNWNSGPMNSPPLSWIQRAGHGYRVSQTCAYFLAMWAKVLSSIRISFTKFEPVLIIVRVWTHKVYLELGLSKVRLSQQHIPKMAMNESRAQASVRILCHQA